jgi:outer membrane autotransporter protein
VPSITTGADANAYICGSAPTLSFVPDAAAAMVVTTAPAQYVRVYCPECTPSSAPNRSFMADPGIIRGLTPEQIKDVLALPTLPSMITIVQVPIGTCVLVAKGAAIPGFGTGGTAQAYAAGTTSGPNCENLQFLPASAYVNQQAIGALALVYGPRAGSGNAGAVAATLDGGPFPDPFTEMDLVYKSLDLLNFGAPGPLRSALHQLGGEINADVPTVAIGAGQLFLGAVRAQLRNGSPAAGLARSWVTAVGGGGTLAGNGNSHDLWSMLGGLVGGIERRFDPPLVAGIAFGWVGGDFNLSGLSGRGTISSFAVMTYARYAPGRWYVEGVAGYGANTARLDRAIAFPGVARSASSSPTSSAFLSQAEAGYRIDLDARRSVTPFAALQAIVVAQDAFHESGAGAINLEVSGSTTTSARSIFGAELTYAWPAGGPSPLQVTGRLGWAHELAGAGRTATAFLSGTPSAAPFTVAGAQAIRDAVIFGGGLLGSQPGLDLFIRYEGAADSRSLIHGGSAGLRLTF